MKKQLSLCNITIKLLMTLLFIISNAIPASWAIDNVQCDLLNSGGSFNVLTINLLFHEVKTRQSRLENIAKFVADNDVHAILLQEVVGGTLAGTNNSAEDLRDILSKTYGLQYDLRTEFEVGLPGLLNEGNAILSRCQIEFGRDKQLPGADEELFNGQVIKLPRNVMMLRLAIPGFGDIDVYNTHLCASCPPSDRLKQLDVLLAFLNDVEQNAPDSHPIVLGGDLNTDIFKDDGAEKPVYDKIIGEGFIDSYAYYQTRLNPTTHDILEELCLRPEVPDRHCTIGVSNLGDSKARRIDYLFIRNFGAVKESRVVFNTKIDRSQPTVSDHAGVFTSQTSLSADIQFTSVPDYGSSADLRGIVLHVQPTDYRVAVYINVSGNWWTKPTATQPITTIQSDGSWVCDITTGGDETATLIAAFLIPASYNPPVLLGAATLPKELTNNAIASQQVERWPILPVYRFNNGAYHFYTISESEKDYILQNMPGWKLEGIAYLTYAAPYPSALPVYRFNTGTYHFYTISEEEKNNILLNYPQWKLEGIAFYADSFSGRAPYPVYRFNTGTYHFYTISEEEKNNILVNFPSWVLEGIAFYAYL